MHEYSSVSASNAAALADALNDSASAGWSVIGVVNDGGGVSALLARDASWTPDVAPAAAAPAVEAAAPAPVVEVAPQPEPAPAPAPVAAPEPAGWAVAPEPTSPAPAAMAPIIEPTPAAPTAQYQAVAPSAAAPVAAAPAVPSGWYADPAGRFELRYWDGTTWTEHVSRAGQQFTDPPIA
jgi:hypothetical protein